MSPHTADTNSTTIEDREQLFTTGFLTP